MIFNEVLLKMQKHHQVKEKHAERLKVMQQPGGQSDSLMLLRHKMNATEKNTIQDLIFLDLKCLHPVSVFIPFTPH